MLIETFCNKLKTQIMLFNLEADESQNENQNKLIWTCKCSSSKRTLFLRVLVIVQVILGGFNTVSFFNVMFSERRCWPIRCYLASQMRRMSKFLQYKITLLFFCGFFFPSWKKAVVCRGKMFYLPSSYSEKHRAVKSLWYVVQHKT